MILYFSGTGNSRYISEVINSILNDEIVCINDYLKNNQKSIFESTKPYIIVCPTYAWRIPRVVEEFISNNVFNGNKMIYFVLTCGSSIGNAKKYVKELCDRVGLMYIGIKGIIMPENFITMFKAPDKDEAKKIISQAIKPSLLVAKRINEKDKLDDEKCNLIDKIASSFINYVFYLMFVKSDGFYVKENCNGCATCKKLCPLNNIEFVDNKPKWNNRCTQCMACIGGCPLNAIEYKKRTQNKVRYYLNEHYR